MQKIERSYSSICNIDKDCCKEIENEMKHDSVRQMNLTYRANGEKMHRKKIEMEINKAINDYRIANIDKHCMGRFAL